MTVDELRKALADLPGNLPVQVSSASGYARSDDLRVSVADEDEDDDRRVVIAID